MLLLLLFLFVCLFVLFSESPLLVIAEAMFSKKATFLHVFINCLSVPTCILCHGYNLV